MSNEFLAAQAKFGCFSKGFASDQMRKFVNEMPFHIKVQMIGWVQQQIGVASATIHDLTAEMEHLGRFQIIATQSLAAELPIKQQKEPSDGCCICMDDAANVVILPCTHLCICKQCGHKLKNCPICRGHINSLLPVIVNE